MIPEKVQDVLTKNELGALEFEPGSTPTAKMAADKIGVAVGQIAKSILFKTKDQRFVLVVCRGDKKVSSGKLKKLVSVSTSMATRDETKAATDFFPGEVCPFGVDLPVFLDEGLAEYSLVYPAAGTNSSGVPITLSKLAEITNGKVVDIVQGC